MSDTSEVIHIKRDPVGKAHDVWAAHESPEGYDYARLWAFSQVNAPREASVDVARLQWLPILTNILSVGAIVASGKGELRQRNMRLEFLEHVLRVLDPYLSSYFGCEYMPLFLRFYSNEPDHEKPYSSNWHCDAGPRKHLKVLVYLNSSKESGGNTEFLNYDTTMRFDETGYLFTALDSRIDDLSVVAEQYGIPYQPIRQSMQTGWGVLFEPSCIMHRAVWPTISTRYMAQICFLPSPVPWREACEMFGMPFEDNTWRRFELEESHDIPV